MRKSCWLKTIGIGLLLNILAGCQHSPSKQHSGKVDFVLEERDLVPEGLAFDSVTRSIFVSSTYQRKIVRIDSLGRVNDFIASAQDGIWSVIGMEVDAARRHLWVISSQATDVLPMKNPDTLQWHSALFQYSLEDNKLIRSWRLSNHPVFLNDLTVTPKGEVYLTESVNSVIYRLGPKIDSIVEFLSLPAFPFINGLAFDDNNTHLFVASDSGIVKITCSSLDFKLIKPNAGINSKGIDGLSYYRNTLIAHQSNKVVLLKLDETEDSIIESHLLDSGPDFDGSTTGERSRDNYYYIVNSQIGSAIDKEKKTLKPWDSLEQIIIRKIKL